MSDIIIEEQTHALSDALAIGDLVQQVCKWSVVSSGNVGVVLDIIYPHGFGYQDEDAYLVLDADGRITYWDGAKKESR